jgi:hypothetical protein
MSMYMIICEMQDSDVSGPLCKIMSQCSAARLLESVWVVEYPGPASSVRDALLAQIDAQGVVVVQLQPHFDWATMRAQVDGRKWIEARSP